MTRIFLLFAFSLILSFSLATFSIPVVGKDRGTRKLGLRIPVSSEPVDAPQRLLNLRNLMLAREWAREGGLGSPIERAPILNEGAGLYYGVVGLGVPRQNFTVVFESTVANLFVPSLQCKSLGCRAHPRYDSSQSATYEADGRNVSYNFGEDSANVEGFFSKDNMYLGDLEVDGVTFVEMDKVSRISYADLSYDGVFGLGTINISLLHEVTALELGYKQGKLHHNNFAIYLAANQTEGSVIILGDNDESLYEGSMMYYHTLNETHYVLFPSEFQFGKINHKEETKAIISSGRSSIYMPSTIFDKVVNEIGANFTCDDIVNFPDMVFTIFYTQYTLSPWNYVLRETVNGSPVCTLNILPSKILPEELREQFVFGTPFLEKYFVYFDVRNKQIGLAPSVQPAPTPSPP